MKIISGPSVLIIIGGFFMWRDTALTTNVVWTLPWTWHRSHGGTCLPRCQSLDVRWSSLHDLSPLPSPSHLQKVHLPPLLQFLPWLSLPSNLSEGRCTDRVGWGRKIHIWHALRGHVPGIPPWHALSSPSPLRYSICSVGQQSSMYVWVCAALCVEESYKFVPRYSDLYQG